jgi:hypothetical protein
MLEDAGGSSIPAVFTASLALRAVMLLLESTEKRSVLTDEYKNISEEGASGPYNLGVFYWLSSLFFTGYKKILAHEDLYQLDDTLRSEPLAKKMSEAWEEGQWHCGSRSPHTTSKSPLEFTEILTLRLFSI